MTEPERQNKELYRVPVSTYRLQMHRHFGFLDALRCIPYLHRLGVTDCYTSPLLKAKAGSLHGYDITDHHCLNPELGSESDYDQMASLLRDLGMGHLLDYVPNHMGIDPADNPWWHDVLENGPSSPYGRYFDIDWRPLKPELRNKVLLPILGDQYGAVLERGEFRLALDHGALLLRYGDQQLPVNPRCTPDVLKCHMEELQKELGDTPELREYLSTLTELSNLPATTEQDTERIKERQREKEVARGRLAKLFLTSPAIRRHVQSCLEFFNGQPGKPGSFDALHKLLEAQAYRLAYWKTASHEINYRRFFDINQLAGLCMEKPDVFEATHQRLLDLVHRSQVTGLRLDHPDGLYDPAGYFEQLRTNAGSLYVVVEKILSAGETLRKAWLIDGTTGYDFLNLVNHLMINTPQGPKLSDIYQRFTGRSSDSDEEIYRSKKLIMSTSMASELNVLAHLLNQISETNRLWRDFTLDSLRDALKEVVACFPVYRTYIRGSTASPSDELTITKAVAKAKGLNPAMESSIFDFIRAMLVPQRTPDMAPEQYERHLQFAMKFQQYTAPVQAKGVEDTAFYRHNVLLSINEVGGDLNRFGISVSDIHQANLDRQRDWPCSLLTTATHDTKRGEDARARLDVLSERPEEWEQAVFQWSAMNRRHKTLLEGRPCPDANDEYLLYQSMLGAWVPGSRATDSSDLLSRLCRFAVKATREAKRHTSWIRPNEDYEKATLEFLNRILTDRTAGGFLSVFEPFAQSIATDGMLNSLAQLTLKMAVPGVPDIYQGNELWDWSMVDPDNRNSVDYDMRERMLAELEVLCTPAVVERESGQRAAFRQLMHDWEDGRIKMLITAKGLRYRRAHRKLFLKGSYIPLKVLGGNDDHVIAFARQWGQENVVVVVPRLMCRFKSENRSWKATRVQLPDHCAVKTSKHLFTGETFPITQAGESPELGLAEVFSSLPVAWLSLE